MLQYGYKKHMFDYLIIKLEHISNCFMTMTLRLLEFHFLRTWQTNKFQSGPGSTSACACAVTV